MKMVTNGLPALRLREASGLAASFPGRLILANIVWKGTWGSMHHCLQGRFLWVMTMEGRRKEDDDSWRPTETTRLAPSPGSWVEAGVRRG
jgi:hypothetical protein